MKIILNILFSVLAVMVAAYLVPDVSVDTYQTAFVLAIVLGILNTFIKPVIKLLALPITILTLGLFSFVINIGLIYLASWIVSGFDIASLWGAVLFSIILSLVNALFSLLKK